MTGASYFNNLLHSQFLLQTQRPLLSGSCTPYIIPTCSVQSSYSGFLSIPRPYAPAFPFP